MGPQTDDLDGLDVVQHLVHKSVLDSDPAREGAGEVSNESLVRRGILIGILFEDFKKALGLRFESGTRQLLGITSGMTGVDKLPSYQSSFSWHFSTGVFKPLRIEARIPGMAFRYSVS